MTTRADRISEQRLQKLQNIRAMGIDPYPARFKRTHMAQQAIELLTKQEQSGTTEPITVTVAGRIMANRKMGKISFLDIRDDSGKIQLLIVQVQCCLCGYRFCPYKEQIGLAFTDRISPTLKQRQLKLTCQISYHKARTFIASCLGVGPSEPTIRKEIDRRAGEIRQIPVTANRQIVYHDATKVKAGSKDRGVSIHLAVTSTPGTQRHRRKRLLFLRTGSAQQIKKSLAALKARGIVHDGDMDLSGCARFLQRCLWHLAHQLKHFLWQDGLPFEARGPYVKELIFILHQSPSVRTMKKQYQSFVQKLSTHGLVQSAGHLQNAESEMATFREHGIVGSTTSPVEREMREINRRADIGVRWSVPGIENLLLVKTHMVMNEP